MAGTIHVALGRKVPVRGTAPAVPFPARPYTPRITHTLAGTLSRAVHADRCDHAAGLTEDS
jgi:hypothetical protein